MELSLVGELVRLHHEKGSSSTASESSYNLNLLKPYGREALYITSY